MRKDGPNFVLDNNEKQKDFHY